MNIISTNIYLPFAPQSAQNLFASSFSNSDKITWLVFCFCPLSFCVLEFIITGNRLRKIEVNLRSQKLRRSCVNRQLLSPRTYNGDGVAPTSLYDVTRPEHRLPVGTLCMGNYYVPNIYYIISYILCPI